MSLQDFQILDDDIVDNSIIERVFLKVYHQQRAQLNQWDQNMEIFFAGNNNFHQMGNGYLEFDITVSRSDTTNFHYDDPIRLVNFACAFCFKEDRSSTTLGSDLKRNRTLNKLIRIIYLGKKAGCISNPFNLT